MNRPGPAAEIVNCPRSGPAEIVAEPGFAFSGTRNTICCALAPITVTGTPLTSTVGNGSGNAAKAAAKDPGATPDSGRKLAPFTTTMSPVGNAGALDIRANTAARYGSCRA